MTRCLAPPSRLLVSPPAAPVHSPVDGRVRFKRDLVPRRQVLFEFQIYLFRFNLVGHAANLLLARLAVFTHDPMRNT